MEGPENRPWISLGREESGIRVLKARETMRVEDIPAVPQTPAHVQEVINLRGKILLETERVLTNQDLHGIEAVFDRN